ncbi:MAG: M28 family peptidase [Candidatus Poseidoniales archaeon]|nr:M28 family peptidase [Candidatus Poseidoniales archaeon]
MLTLLIFLASFSGCFGDPSEDAGAKLSIDPIEQAVRGQIMSIHVESNMEWTVNRTAGLFFVDDDGIFRDNLEMTFTSDVEDFEILVLDSERTDVELIVTAGNQVENITMQLIDSDEMMLVDGRRAFDTIDMLTTDHNNRWCASADTALTGNGANYEAAAEAMKSIWDDYGFDFVEVTRYDDDPDQLNVVGYKYGNVYPDQYIVIGGHFDVAYAATPPGGGTSEGANDDTSGSTVSMELAQALGSREWDHTVVAGLWACEEEGLLGSDAFVAHLPEGKSVKAYMNFDMVSLNYPIIPPPGYGPYDLSIATAGASDDNLSIMLEWVRLVVEDEMNFHDVASNDIYWQAAESCASDHCSFFSSGYATFNFFSAGGDASFWQEWHSGTDNLDFMVTKAGGSDNLGDGFNTLVWTALSLFVHVDNTDDSFQGRWYTGGE